MKTSIIYLLGAGRSGTTLIATVLNSHSKIQTIGEMHQFLEHLKYDKKCSCGAELNKCTFWAPVLNKLKLNKESLSNNYQIAKVKEGHRNIPKLLFSKNEDQVYFATQEPIFESVNQLVKEKWLLDSSKYIGRYLLLKRSDKLSLKGVYVVRDVRGVINSFGKQVQTPKSPISTIMYYSLINFFGQLVCWLDKDVIKIKYEDFVLFPEETANDIYNHIFGDTKFNEDIPLKFEIPHIIGGNRMKSKREINISSDDKWKVLISRPKQFLYYILSSPIMLLNRYKI